MLRVGTISMRVRLSASWKMLRSNKFSPLSLAGSLRACSNLSTKDEERDVETRILKKLKLHPSQLVAGENFNRWALIPAAVGNHLCLGSVFAWSIFNQPLTRLEGVVAPAAIDWTLGDVSLTFALIMGGFFWGAVFGKKLDKWGPRASCMIGATCLGSGFGLAALAISLHDIYLLYAGGAIWGLANGWAYVPPVATLMSWFPDKKGFASGMCILGYGGGAMIAAPLFSKLLQEFQVAPTRIGSVGEVALRNEGGLLFANVSDTLSEVVVATAADTLSWGLEEGVYLVGTGSTGTAETFLTLGAMYSSLMFTSSLFYRSPPPDYQVAQPVGSTEGGASGPAITQHDVAVDVATRSPQFWLMWAGFGLAATGAYGLLSIGKNMLEEGFGSAMPDVVTAGFTAAFVSMISAGNMAGRVFWSNGSDVLARWKSNDPFYGRRLTFSLMWGIGPPLYMATIWSLHQCQGELTSSLPLFVFCGSCVLIVSSFGGSAATRPAMMGDVFGTKNVGVLTARSLSVVLPASYFGQKIGTTFRKHSVDNAIFELTEKVDDTAFHHAFGVDKSQLDSLIEAKTVSINRLMEIAPLGTMDPTPFVYDNVLYIMAALQGCGFLLNQMVKPIDSKYHLKPDEKIQENK